MTLKVDLSIAALDFPSSITHVDKAPEILHAWYYISSSYFCMWWTLFFHWSDLSIAYTWIML